MKGLKGIILGVLLAASVLMPFNVYAGTVTGDAPIIGVNVYVIDYEYGKIPVQGTVTLETDMTRWQCVSGSSSRCAVWQSQDTSDVVQNDITGTITYSNGSYSASLYEFDFVFDDEYVGYVRFSSQITAGSGNIYYVNGSHLTITSTTLINSFTITEYQLTRKTSDSLMWMFPVESFNAIYYAKNQGFEITDFFNYSQYMWPIFLSDNTKNAFGYNYAPNVELTVILWNGNGNVWDKTSFQNRFTFNGSIKSFETISAISGGRFIKVVFINETNSNLNLNLKFVDNNVKWIPIFISQDSFKDIISTDFALQFRLRNELLDNIQIIANGTVNSNQSASNLESGNDQMSDDMNDLATIENGYNQDFNNQLQNIDFTNPIQSNQGILPAANFVISVFNGLINNNPFSLLIIVCCILLIGKRVIGK